MNATRTFIAYDDTETISRMKEDAGTHDRPYGKLQLMALRFLGLVLGRHIV